MQARRAFYAGINASFAMMVVLALLPIRLLPQNLGLVLGSLVIREISLTAWAVGLVIHLALGGVVGLVYGAFFDRVLGRAGGVAGLLLGAAHCLIAGPLLGVLAHVHPLMPVPLAPPGVFFSGLGMLGVAMFVIIHLLYGLIVGGICADGVPAPAPVHPAHARHDAYAAQQASSREGSTSLTIP